MKSTLTILFFFFFYIGFPQKNSKEEFYQVNDSINLFVFIGEKILVTEFDPNLNNKTIEIDSITGDTIIHTIRVMDAGFNAKYKVVKNVYNNLKTDTIDFVAYDHYGRPGFEKFKTVLLYISKSDDGKYYFHQKYQYDPLIKTRKGIWNGRNRESISELFNSKKELFKARGIFP